MNRMRPWFIGLWLPLLFGLWLIPIDTLRAQSSQGNAVVLLAPSNLPETERSVLLALMQNLNNKLGAEDRIGVILYSDIVDHVSALAPPTADEPARMQRVLDSLPAVDPLNSAVGIDRALELLSETPLQKSIIIISRFDVRLEDGVLKGRYSRWLEGTLLPTAASERIALMMIAEKSSHQGLLQRYGINTFATMAASELDAQALSALALEHVYTPITEPVAVASTPETQPKALPSPPDATLAVDSTVDPLLQSIEPVADPVDGSVAEQIPQAPASGLIARLTSFSMAPLFILAAIILGLIGAGVFYHFVHRQRRSPKASHVRRDTQTLENPTEPALVDPFNQSLHTTAISADETYQRTQSNSDGGESRFDALIDSLSSGAQANDDPATGDQATLPVKTRMADEDDDVTIDTRTVDTRRKRAADTADMTRELEDLTKARNTQYDFE